MMRWISAELLLASLLIGLAHVAGLPPFEGIDESAHYSYIEQIARTGTLPRVGDKLWQDEDAQYLEGSLEAGRDPYRPTLRYHNLFTGDAKIIKRVRQAVKAPRDPPPTSKPSGREDWQAQH